MSTFRDVTTGREYPHGSIGELHRQLDVLVDQLDSEAKYLAHGPLLGAIGLDEVGHTCQQLARRILKIGVAANTARVTAEAARTEGVA